MFGVIKNRLCKYLLKRLFGRYLDEDLDTIKVVVEGDTLTVRNFRLRSGPGSYLSYLDSAYADLVTVYIPWRSLLRDGCKIVISGFAIEITHDSKNSGRSSSAIPSNPLSPSNDPYLHRALLALFNSDYQEEDILDETGIEDMLIGSNRKSLDCVSDYICQILSKTHVTITNVRLNFRPAEEVNFTVNIPSLWFQNGVLNFDEGAKVHEERFPEPVLTVGDSARAVIDDRILTFDVDTIEGRLPVSLLRFFKQSTPPLQTESRSELSASEPKAIGDFANINQFKVNIGRLAVALQSNEAQFGLNLKQAALDLTISPKMALRSCSIAVCNIVDVIDAIPVLQFTRRERDPKPDFLLRPNGLDLQPFLVSANVHTVYRLKSLLRETLKQVLVSDAPSSTQGIREDFVVSVMGPITLQYTGYLELCIRSPLTAVVGSRTTVLTLDSSVIELREIQQDPIVLFSAELSCSVRYRYSNGDISAIPTFFPNQRRTSSRIYQTDDYVSNPDSFLLPVSYKLEYMDAAQVTATCQLANIEVYLNEHVITGLYSAFDNHARNPAASAVDFSKVACTWAVSAICDGMRVFYSAPKWQFLLLAENGFSVFASPVTVSASVSSLCLKKDSVDIISHVVRSANSLSFAAFESWAIWRENQLDVSTVIRNMVVSLNQDALDLVECALSLSSMIKKLGTRHKIAASSSSSSSRSVSFQSTTEDCAILLSPADSSGTRLTLVFEKLCQTVTRNRFYILLCGLSLHLIDQQPSPVTFKSHHADSLVDYLIDSGHVVILSLDVAEGDRHLSTVSLNVGHVALMACTDTVTLTYRAGVAIWEHISPRLLAFASSEKSSEDRFSISQKHVNTVSLAALQVLTTNPASGGTPAAPNIYEVDLSEDVTIEINNSLWSEELTNESCGDVPRVLSVIEESYSAIRSVTLPNQNEAKAVYHQTDFRIIETHFASIDVVPDNESHFFDQKIVSSDGSSPNLQLSFNLRIEGITLRLFGGLDFRERRSGIPVFRRDLSPTAGTDEDYIQAIFGSFEPISTTLPAYKPSVNGSGRHRESTDVIEIVLSELQISRRSYTTSANTSESHKFYGTLAGIVILDHVKESHFGKVLGPLVSKRRNDRIKALTISIESVNAASYCAEHRVEVQLAPLDLTLDGATLAFAIQFATGIESVLEPVVVTPLEDESDTIQVLANLDPTVYVHFFECSATALNVTYHPSNMDLGCIDGPADYIKLLQLLPVQDATFELKHVSLRGLSGYTRAVCDMIQIWARDIARNQYHRYLASIVPFRSVVRLGSSVRDLVFAPICDRIHHIVPAAGHHHGASSHTRNGNSVHVARQFGTEAVSLAVVMLSGTEVMLDAFDGRGPNQVYDREPSGFCDGLRCALTSVAEGARLASNSIVGVPLREWRKHSGGIEAFRSFIRGVPLAILQPARAATHALKVTLQGLKNTIDVDTAEQRRLSQRRRRR